MALSVEIDKRSGFCGGVIRAISKAEEFLDAHPGKKLYSLGAIVHNEAELARLSAKGLVTISKEDIADIPEPTSETLLIRAHGEPPSTYELARKVGINVIDCTCPVVLKLQKDIRKTYSPQRQTVVIENMDMLLSALEDGTIRTDVPLEIFSQTTKSPTEYSRICDSLTKRATAGLTIHNTICSQVASRHEELTSFAQSHDIIIFVSGASSSNGKVLCDLCLSRNPRTYHISSQEEIDPSWFHPDDQVGICGATSTPRWLLEEVAEAIRAIQLSL